MAVRPTARPLWGSKPAPLHARKLFGAGLRLLWIQTGAKAKRTRKRQKAGAADSLAKRRRLARMPSRHVTARIAREVCSLPGTIQRDRRGARRHTGAPT